MRYLLTILFFFIAYVVNAQYIPNSAAYQYKGLKQTNSLQPPTGAAFPVTATNAPDSNYAAWFYNTLDTSFYQFNPIPKTWTRLHASGGIQVDSVFISSIDSIYITNTDSIFIITNNNDTIFIGSGNPAVDTIYQRGPDSIFAVKSGVEFLAAVTGASAPSGGMDTAYTRSDSILGVKNNGEFLISEVQASIDSIFITNSDSIFIITGNDTVFIGQANAMDSAYLRGDSIFGIKGGNEFFIALTGNASISLLPLSPGYGIIGSDYNGTSPQTWAIDTSILNNVIFIDSSSIEFFVDSIANTPTGTEASGTKYLVGTSPTGVFTGHANEIATLTGAIWSFTIPVAGDNLVVSNETQPTSFYQFDGANWNLTRRSASIGGDAIGANYDLGTLDHRSFRFLTNGAWKEVISAAGSHYFRRYVGASSNNYLKIVDTATGRMDTASFTPLVLTTNGSAGPAELINDTLNIPIYTGAGPHNDTLYYNVEWFGAVHDSVTDDGPAIQAGVDYIHNYAPGAILFFPAGNYRDTSHVHWRSKVNALGEGEASNIFNDLPNHTRFGDQAPIFFGNLTPSAWDSTDLRYFSASYANANKVKVVDSISRFAVGDIVIMRGATYWLNTDGQVRPHVVRENRVVAIDGDTLFLEEPLDTVITKIAISGHYITGSGRRLDVYGELSQFISDCSINNLKLTSVYGDVALGIAMFKCNFNNVWTYGKESLGGNGESFCSFNNIYATFSKQAWENSIGTHNTTVNFLRANWNGIEDAENKPVAKFGESVYAVHFTNLDINANGFDGKGIWFGAATHCSVNGFRIKGEGMNDNLIEFSNSNNVISNIVRNGKLFSSTSSHYIEIEKNAGVNARLDDNLIEHVEAYGNTGANGVVIDGRNTVIKDSYFEDGNLSFGDSLVNYKIDNTTINGGYYLSKSNISTSGIIDVTGGLHLTTLAGTPGTDSVLVQNNGVVKRISPTYYSTGGGGGAGTVTNIATTSPITGGPITTTGTIGITQATTSTDGYLSSTDWNTFNNKFNLPSLTSGSVLFSNGTTISQNNSNFFWDNSNTRLGIGTAAPTNTLHVNGDVRINTLANGTGGSDSIIVVNGGVLKRVSYTSIVPNLQNVLIAGKTSDTAAYFYKNGLGNTNPVINGLVVADTTTTVSNGQVNISPSIEHIASAYSNGGAVSVLMKGGLYIEPVAGGGNGFNFRWYSRNATTGVTTTLLSLASATANLTTTGTMIAAAFQGASISNGGGNFNITGRAVNTTGNPNPSVGINSGITHTATSGNVINVAIFGNYNEASGAANNKGTLWVNDYLQAVSSSTDQYAIRYTQSTATNGTGTLTDKWYVSNAGTMNAISGNIGAYVAKTGTYTITGTDETIETTSGTFTLTLPTAVGRAGQKYFITNSGSGTITIATTSSQTFVNVTATPTTLTLNQFDAKIIISNGANWLAK